MNAAPLPAHEMISAMLDHLIKVARRAKSAHRTGGLMAYELNQIDDIVSSIDMLISRDGRAFHGKRRRYGVDEDAEMQESEK
jgi:hypothetical protein